MTTNEEIEPEEKNWERPMVYKLFDKDGKVLKIRIFRDGLTFTDEAGNFFSWDGNSRNLFRCMESELDT